MKKMNVEREKTTPERSILLSPAIWQHPLELDEA
jgi:hypothetical protein